LVAVLLSTGFAAHPGGELLPALSLAGGSSVAAATIFYLRGGFAARRTASSALLLQIFCILW